MGKAVLNDYHTKRLTKYSVGVSATLTITTEVFVAKNWIYDWRE